MALTLLCSAFAHADEADEAAKAEFLDKINQAITQCDQRVQRMDRCCHGSAKDCAGVDKKTTVAIISATSKIKSSAEAADDFSSVGAAEHMGELTDSVKQAGDAMVSACNSLADSCSQSCTADYDSIKAACPGCETDMEDLKVSAGKCKSSYAGAGPVSGKQPVHQPPGAQPSEGIPVSAGPIIDPPRAIPEVPASPAPPSPNSNRDQHQPLTAERKPYQIENDNSEWRKSLNNNLNNNRPNSQMDDLLSTFSQAAAVPSHANFGNSMNVQSTNGANEPMPAAPSGATPPATQNVPVAREGTIGMREGSVRKAGVSPAPAQAATNFAAQPFIAASLPRGAVGFMGSASVTGTSRGPSSSSFVSSSMPRTLGGQGPRNLYKAQDAGVAGGGGGGGARTQSASQPQLADYLPNGRLGPTSTAIAGGAATANPQILSQGKDVWQNMSMRLQYFCKIGRLYDCK